MRRIRLMVALVAAMLVATATMASAAPSDEGVARASVCSALKQPGVTAGLYGLCTAFCTTNPGTASVLANYNAKKKASDPAMPCVPQSAHPCWSAAEIAAIGVTYSPHTVDLLEHAVDVFRSIGLAEIRVATDELPYGAFLVAQLDTDGETFECRYFDSNFAPGSPAPTIRALTITEEQWMAALTEIYAQVQRLRDAGVVVI